LKPTRRLLAVALPPVGDWPSGLAPNNSHRIGSIQTVKNVKSLEGGHVFPRGFVLLFSDIYFLKSLILAVNDL
jgi:hypothetical protein